MPSSNFFAQHIVPIFFLYGLAFFSMGLAVSLESGRASELRFARALRPLAGFGILHGIHEWFEMFQKMAAQMPGGYVAPVGVELIRLTLLAFSFLLLATFGACLIRREGSLPRHGICPVATILALIWLLGILAVRVGLRPSLREWLVAADVLSRYLIAVPGSLIASWGLVLQQRAFREGGMARFGRDLLWAAVAFFWYGSIGQVFAHPSIVFPSTVLNSELFLSVFGFPVQLLRAAMASLVAIFVIRALRAFELERQRVLAAAHEARLKAQQEALEAQQRVQKETKRLYQELQEVAQELSMLYDLSRILASTLDLGTMLNAAARKIATSLEGIDGCMILLRQDGLDRIEVMTADGLIEEVARARAEAAAQCAVQYGRVCWGSDEGCRATIGGHVVALPLATGQSQIVGSLAVWAQPHRPSLTADDLPLLSTIAGQVSIAVENAQLYQAAQEREVLRGEMLHRVVAAQEAERQRIARELHDETSQALTALAMGLKGVEQTVLADPVRAQQQLSELRSLAVNSLDTLRRLIADLRPSQLDDLGLIAALRWYVDEFRQRTAICVEMNVAGPRRRLSPQVETVLFRVAQEALTNVARHAQASHVRVSLAFTSNQVQLAVADDGRGFSLEQVLGAAAPPLGRRERRAWGLLGMQERAALVGGTYQIRSQPGQGTEIAITVPLEPQELEYGAESDSADAGR